MAAGRGEAEVGEAEDAAELHGALQKYRGELQQCRGELAARTRWHGEATEALRCAERQGSRLHVTLVESQAAGVAAAAEVARLRGQAERAHACVAKLRTELIKAHAKAAEAAREHAKQGKAQAEAAAAMVAGLATDYPLAYLANVAAGGARHGSAAETGAETGAERGERRAERGTLRVTLRRASGLAAGDLNGLSDPYALLLLRGVKHKSKTVNRSLSPRWDETFSFEGSLAELTAEALLLEVFDSDWVTRDDFLGRASVDLTSLRTSHEEELEVCLDPQGVVLLLLEWTPTPQQTQGRGGASRDAGAKVGGGAVIAASAVNARPQSAAVTPSACGKGGAPDLTADPGLFEPSAQELYALHDSLRVARADRADMELRVGEMRKALQSAKGGAAAASKRAAASEAEASSLRLQLGAAVGAVTEAEDRFEAAAHAVASVEGEARRREVHSWVLRGEVMLLERSLVAADARQSPAPIASTPIASAPSPVSPSASAADRRRLFSGAPSPPAPATVMSNTTRRTPGSTPALLGSSRRSPPLPPPPPSSPPSQEQDQSWSSGVWNRLGSWT